MRLVIRFIIELIIFLVVILGGICFSEVAFTFFNLSMIDFTLSILFSYVIIRTLINILVKYLTYRKSIKIEKDNLDLVKVIFERCVYGHILVIIVCLFYFNVMRIAFLVLFFIFGLLYLLATISLEIIKTKKMEGIQSDDSKEESKFYNLFSFKYYSKECYEFLDIITGNTFGILNNFLNDNSIVMIDKLSKSNYLFFNQRSMYFGDINIFCGIVNSYLEKLDIKCRISKEDILSKDNLELTTKRKNFEDTSFNDFRILDEKLKNKHYRIYGLELIDEDESYLGYGIVSDDIFRRFSKFSRKRS